MLRDKLNEYTNTQKTLKLMLMRDLFPSFELHQQQTQQKSQQLLNNLQPQRKLNNNNNNNNNNINKDPNYRNYTGVGSPAAFPSSPRPKRVVSIRRISSSSSLDMVVSSLEQQLQHHHEQLHNNTHTSTESDVGISAPPPIEAVQSTPMVLHNPNLGLVGA
jgi:hypothetical protein